MKYRKKPVVIDAWPVADLLKAAAGNWAALPSEVAAAYERGEILFPADGLEVITLEGVMSASRDGWLLRGIAGEFYPCAAEIFAATYELVEQA